MTSAKRKLRDRVTFQIASVILYIGCSTAARKRVQKAINIGYHEMNVNGFGEQLVGKPHSEPSASSSGTPHTRRWVLQENA